MFGIKLKVIVAMVTELCTHSISAMACSACHAPEICILHTSANFESQRHNFSQTNNFSQIIKLGVINDNIEKTIESQKRVKIWMCEKNRELRKIHPEEKKREEAEKAAGMKMEVNLPGDTIKIRPQLAPAYRPEDVKIDEAECKGEKTPGYVKDQIHQKREIEEENKRAKLIKRKPHPLQAKFIYKRPVAGKIKFRMQQERAKSPHGEKWDSEKD